MGKMVTNGVALFFNQEGVQVMSNVKEQQYVEQSDFEDRFLEMRKHQCRIETRQIEMSRELDHHSQLLSELKSDVQGLKSDMGLVKQELGMQSNMLKQLLEIVGDK